MKLFHEEIIENEKVLLVYTKETQLISALAQRLKTYNIDTFASASVPSQLSIYKRVFFFEKLPKNASTPKSLSQSVLITYSISKREIEKILKDNPAVRIVVTNKHASTENIETILGFVFASNANRVLDLTHTLKPSVSKSVRRIHFRWPKPPSRRRAMTYFLIFFLLFEVSFLIPMGIGAGFLYKSIKEARSNNLTASSRALSHAKPFLKGGELLYSMARPTLSFFSLALLPDSLMTTVNATSGMMTYSLSIEKRASNILSLMLDENKTPNQVAQIRADIVRMNRDIQRLHETSLVLSRNIDSLPVKIPVSVHSDLDGAVLTLTRVRQLSNNLDTLLGGKGAKRYVLFFYNNMELRPGGGFLGSFATVNFDNYTMKDLIVYDVYDADGQLKVHLEPPEAIRDHLQQPHWFLRDSNFSPDFPENVKNAQVFLEKEMGFATFDGAIGITTTGITNVIDAFGTLYVPDYKETVDKNNFYLKTQERAQTNFFPGSTQKKSFLSALLQTMLANLGGVNKGALGRNMLQSLEEKHIVLNFTDPTIQQTITQTGWGGAILQSECIRNTTCISNSLIPIDANLGVNKANFFVSREFGINTQIDQDGTVHNSFTSHIQNDSPDNEFGGDYKNFFRLYIPRSATVKKVLVNGKEVNDFTEKSTAYFKSIELLVLTEKQSKDIVEVRYSLNQKIKQGANTYQLALQKQIGSLNTNVTMTVSLPKNITIKNKNYPALEKNGTIAYNTTLSGNKIFILELIKR